MTRTSTTSPGRRRDEPLRAAIVTGENRYTASPALFIFLKDGKVAKAVRIIPDAFFGEDAKKKYGRDVVLTPLEGHRGFLNWRD